MVRGLELTGMFWPAASQAWPGQGSQAQSDNVVTQWYNTVSDTTQSQYLVIPHHHQHHLHQQTSLSGGKYFRFPPVDLSKISDASRKKSFVNLNVSVLYLSFLSVTIRKNFDHKKSTELLRHRPVTELVGKKLNLSTNTPRLLSSQNSSRYWFSQSAIREI